MPYDQRRHRDARCIEVEGRLIGRCEAGDRRGQDHATEARQGRLEAGRRHRRNAAIAGADHPDRGAPAIEGGVDEALQFRGMGRAEAKALADAGGVRGRRIRHHDVEAMTQEEIS